MLKKTKQTKIYFEWQSVHFSIGLIFGFVLASTSVRNVFGCVASCYVLTMEVL